MKIEDSKFNLIIQKKIELPVGNFYIFSDYLISEIHKDAKFTWQDAEIIINQVYDFFGTRDVKLSYISNRIHDYDVKAIAWFQFFKNREIVNAVAIINYNENTCILNSIETMVSKNKFRHFDSLEKAISWIKTCKQSFIVNKKARAI